jgi:hypothetical protein
VRLFFDLHPDRKLLEVVLIERRTTTTYIGVPVLENVKDHIDANTYSLLVVAQLEFAAAT